MSTNTLPAAEQAATPLGRKLVESGLLGLDDVFLIESRARDQDISVARAARESQNISSENLARTIADLYSCEYLPNLVGAEPYLPLMDQFGLNRCESAELAILNDFRIVTSDPGLVMDAIDEITAMAPDSSKFQLCVAPAPEIADYLKNLTKGDGSRLQLVEKRNEDARPLLERLLAEAIRMGSTDIHIEPQKDGASEIRFRVDGVLRVIKGFRLSPEDRTALVNVILINSEMDQSAQESSFQDGVYRWTQPGRGVSMDIRISQLPTVFGASLVLRLLYRDEKLENLEDLGYTKNEVDEIRRLSLAPYGLLVVCGPTGSGKSTTLYAILRMLRSVERKIVTVEDPVEMECPGVEQVPVGANRTFAGSIRQFLRHDPDVMLVGEIRDSETARAAMTAAMTGHLVLTTVHANDGPAAVGRLMDLGLSRWDIVANLVGIVSQRLLRRLCPHCRNEVDVMRLSRDYPGLAEILKARNVHRIHVAGECSKCGNGYQKRRILCEIMPADETVREILIHATESFSIQSDLTNKTGFRTLADKAVELIKSGETSVQEAQRVVNLLEGVRGSRG